MTPSFHSPELLILTVYFLYWISLRYSQALLNYLSQARVLCWQDLLSQIIYQPCFHLSANGFEFFHGHSEGCFDDFVSSKVIKGLENNTKGISSNIQFTRIENNDVIWSYTRIACGKIEWRENKRDFQDVHKCMTGISEKQIRWIDKYKKVKEIFYKIHFPWQNSLDCLVISVLKLLSTCLPRKSSISVTKAVCLRSTWGLEML